jgi:hypothetical protein
VERSHRIDAAAFYRMLDHGAVIDDANVFNPNSKNGRTSTASADPRCPSMVKPPRARSA